MSFLREDAADFPHIGEPMRRIVLGGIPADMELVEVNRSALIATVKQPFVDWLHTADPSNKHIGLAEVNHERPFT